MAAKYENWKIVFSSGRTMDNAVFGLQLYDITAWICVRENGRDIKQDSINIFGGERYSSEDIGEFGDLMADYWTFFAKRARDD